MSETQLLTYLMLKFVLSFSQIYWQLRVKGFHALSAESHSHADFTLSTSFSRR